jgi:hypothetical protein
LEQLSLIPLLRGRSSAALHSHHAGEHCRPSIQQQELDAGSLYSHACQLAASLPEYSTVLYLVAWYSAVQSYYRHQLTCVCVNVGERNSIAAPVALPGPRREHHESTTQNPQASYMTTSRSAQRPPKELSRRRPPPTPHPKLRETPHTPSTPSTLVHRDP